MRIGIIGGTGGMGEGFALRWCLQHNVIIGSRDATRASESAKNYSDIANTIYGNRFKASITGDENISLSSQSDILLLSIPYDTIVETCGKLKEVINDNCIVVSPIVPMTRTDAGFAYIPVEQNSKSAAELVADNLPPRTRILSAFHTISEMKLKKVDMSLEADTFLCGDDKANVTILSRLVSEIKGLRPIYLGPLSMSYQAEILTPMLLNAAKKNKLKNPGLKLVE
jgi:8-hydroxy-5-deazaflavin:NADPH oxidoreductase